jgi:hypothetical protein
MVQTTLTPPAETATVADARWVAQTADRILAVMEESLSPKPPTMLSLLGH